MQGMQQYILLGICLLFRQLSFAQYVVKGKVVDETNVGIPFADIDVKNNSNIRTRADIEGNNLMRLQVGSYYLVFSAMESENLAVNLIVGVATKDVNI